MSLLERIYYFHSRIQDGRYPNSGDLAREFEVSAATAHRDITYLRDRLLAPLAFDQRKNGYYYTDSGFCLPFADTPRLVMLLGLLQKMGSETGLANLPELRQLQKRISALVSPERHGLGDLVHCEWIETEEVNPAVFAEVLNGLVSRSRLRITYRSPGGRESEREIDPLRLVSYQGRWYILAWCLLRDSRRLFHLARITEAKETGTEAEHALAPDDDWLAGSFGIFKGEAADRYWAEILLTSTAAQVVRSQRWHPEQRLEETAEGLHLHLPVTDDRELLMKVLQFGSQAQVLAPESLRLKVRTEIANMAHLYNTSET
ncbi:MAG: helix-turn-helix transcriptional regulator [Desulfobulbaceae bacterium]